VIKDAHYEKGLTCTSCHKKEEFHGDGNRYASRKEVKVKPTCVSCHGDRSDKNERAKQAHGQHEEIVTCSACHSLSTYKNCYGCHFGKGSSSKAGFHLGLNPRDLKSITTLRLVPTVRDTFEAVGIKMEKYDTLPNYWDAVPHVVRKTTERTNNCNMCHLVKMGFLTETALIKGGSEANKKLIYKPKPIKK
jgi:hypothetical protein